MSDSGVSSDETDREQPPFKAWFVIEVDVEFDREKPLFTHIRGPYPTEERAERERDEQVDAWERALDEWDGENPYDFKGWQIERVLLRDFQLGKLSREERESFEIRRKAAGALGASLLADEGFGPLAGDSQ